MKWYEELGYEENPLEIDAFKVNFMPIRYEKESEELIYRLKAGNIVVIEGPDGSGKTTLLREATRKLGGRGKMIYFDNKRLGMNLNVENLLEKSQSFFRRIVSKQLKDMILLLDNVNYLSAKNSERIKYYYDQGYLKSVVFTTDDYKKVNFSKSMRDRIGARIIKLAKPDADIVVKMTKSRLGDDLLLSDRMIRKIFGLSRNNVKQHFSNCQSVIAYLVEKNKEKITDQVLVSVVTKNNYCEEDLTKFCYKCGGSLENIKNNWHCPECETYCMKCGSLVNEKDEKCSECGVKFED